MGCRCAQTHREHLRQREQSCSPSATPGGSTREAALRGWVRGQRLARGDPQSWGVRAPRPELHCSVHTTVNVCTRQGHTCPRSPAAQL